MLEQENSFLLKHGVSEGLARDAIARAVKANRNAIDLLNKTYESMAQPRKMG
jgi:hypothetical protein